MNAIYHGMVMHKRLRPFTHELNYRVFNIYLDLDEVPTLAKNTKWFGYNQFNLFSFYDKDHATRDGQPIRPWIEKYLKEFCFENLIGGKIMVLCYPRILGYVFNPLTLYYIYDQSGELGAIFHEVKNTFGEQHGYLMRATKDTRGMIKQSHDKQFHVSPFIQMDAHYDFTLNEPDEKLLVHIHQTVPEGDMLVAKLTSKSAPFNAKELLKCFFKYPLMTLKVIWGIHYEAFHLWRKGVTFYKQPKKIDKDVT